ncbi:MAG: hypothetical protein JWO92_1224 [Chitinophagaceae bacterium]|nr:hypothetical protein [Chitinophagaceae bacterium]
MRKENKLYNFLKGRRSFYYRDIFSSLSNEKMSPALYSSSSATTVLATSSASMKKTSPSIDRIPKQSLDNILHYLLLQQIQQVKKSNKQPAPPQKRHPHFLFQYYKNFQVRKRLRDTALSLLKTQFSKFPVDHGAG